MPAKRKVKRKRSKPRFNVVKQGVVPLVLANATTQGLFGVSLRAFVTGQAPIGSQLPNNNNSWEITATELFRSLTGDNSHMAQNWQDMGGLGAAVRHNFKKNGAMMIGTIIAVPMIEKAASRLLSRVRSPINKTLKGTGVMV